MNGKKAKYLRRSAAFISELPTTHHDKWHRKKAWFPELDKDGKVIAMEEKEYTAHQCVLGNCTRQVYQLMKRFPLSEQHRKYNATQR